MISKGVCSEPEGSTWVRDSLGMGICGERQRNPASLHETTTAPGGWTRRAVLSTGHQHSGEGAKPSLELHQAISRVNDYFLEAEI